MLSTQEAQTSATVAREARRWALTRRAPLAGAAPLLTFMLLMASCGFNGIHLVGASSAMKRLYEDLFADYNRLILPVGNNDTKVTVALNLKLGQILDLNLKQQILSTNVWVEQSWHDHKLAWDPKLYADIDMIHVPAENIWIPDIVLFNNADGNYELTLVAKARIYSNGTVVWKPPNMFRSTCEIDVEYFPFDIQTCYLRLGSWTYAGDELELRHVGQLYPPQGNQAHQSQHQHSNNSSTQQQQQQHHVIQQKPRGTVKIPIGIDLRQFYKNVEWDIIDVPAYYNEIYYECCNEPYPDITFKIVIRRKMLFYLVNLILPVALMTFMTVSVFYLPSDSNEKVTLSISILTSLIVFFLLMLEIIPASSLAVPLFGKYLLFTLVLVSLSACVSVYVLNIHHRSPSVHPLSPRMKRLFLKTLPRLLRLDQPDPRERNSLNRFQRKKIAQQMLANAAALGADRSPTESQKEYNLVGPIATSLNLIEQLHRGYKLDPSSDKIAQNGYRAGDDTQRPSKGKMSVIGGIEEEEDDDGRYFRRYVDEYISRLKTNVAVEQNRQTLRTTTLGRQRSATGSGRNNGDWTESSADLRRPLVRPAKFDELSISQAQNCNTCSQHAQQAARAHAHTGCTCLRLLNDDTLDMTFDYDEEVNGGQSRCPSAANKHHLLDVLPTPPPPPKQLVQLSDSIHGGSLGGTSFQQRGCCTTNSESSSDHSHLMAATYAGTCSRDQDDLVDKLISSINLINTDDVDTTTTSNNDGEDDDAEDACDHYRYAMSQQTIICAQQQQQHHQHHQQQQHIRTVSPAQLRQRRMMPTMAEISSLQERDQSRCSCNAGPLGQPSSQTTSLSAPGAGGPQSRPQAGAADRQPSELLLALRLPYDKMPAHVRAAIRSILFIADTIKNEDDENSAIEDWESVSMVVDRLFLWIFFLLCTFGSVIILALAPSLYDQRASIDDELRLDMPPSNCSAASLDLH